MNNVFYICNVKKQVEGEKGILYKCTHYLGRPNPQDLGQDSYGAGRIPPHCRLVPDIFCRKYGNGIRYGMGQGLVVLKDGKPTKNGDLKQQRKENVQ